MRRSVNPLRFQTESVPTTVRRVLCHYAHGRPVGACLHGPRSAAPTVGMIGDARDALVSAEPVDERGRLENSIMAAAVAPAPDVKTLGGHVAEGGGAGVH